MRTVSDEEDFLARLGGDEFIVLQKMTHPQHTPSHLASQLVGVLGQPFDIDGVQVEIGASIGVAVCPRDGTDASDLLKKTDLALYRVKESGRNGFKTFTQELDNQADRRRRDLAALRRAVDSKSLRLEYQPIIDYRTGKVTAVEALLRFCAPPLSDQNLDYLLELAKEAGLTVQIGNWVLGEACAQLKKWKIAGVGGFKIHVNMCSQELMDSTVVESICNTLLQFQLDPADLEIEITEREAIDIESQGIRTLHYLHSRGIALALDDFGTGYSALGYLQRLPITTLKLDKSFLRGIPHDKHSCAIANLVLGLAHSLGLKLIIEGVESIEQAEFLSQSGSTMFQGFLISKPVDARRLGDWMMESRGPLPAH